MSLPTSAGSGSPARQREVGIICYRQELSYDEQKYDIVLDWSMAIERATGRCIIVSRVRGGIENLSNGSKKARLT